MSQRKRAKKKAGWLDCANRDAMGAYLPGRADRRRITLFAAACCRRVWDLISEQSSRNAVEVLERFADGLASESELAEVVDPARLAHETIAEQDGHAVRSAPLPVRISADSAKIIARERAAGAAYFAVMTADAAYSVLGRQFESPPDPSLVAAQTAASAAYFAVHARIAARRAENPTANRQSIWIETRDAENLVHCDWVRCITPTKGVLEAFAARWRTQSVAAVAQTIYAERRFADLPVLADALEEAGCTCADILDHCRGGQEHVLGCWALDLAVGRE